MSEQFGSKETAEEKRIHNLADVLERAYDRAIYANMHTDDPYAFPRHIRCDFNCRKEGEEVVTLVNWDIEEKLTIARPTSDPEEYNKLRFSDFADGIGGVLYKAKILDMVDSPTRLKTKTGDEISVLSRHFEVYEDKVRSWVYTTQNKVVTAEGQLGDKNYALWSDYIVKVLAFEYMAGDTLYDTEITPDLFIHEQPN